MCFMQTHTHTHTHTHTLTHTHTHTHSHSHSHMQLCIILNNMCHLQQALAGLSKTLDLETYYKVKYKHIRTFMHTLIHTFTHSHIHTYTHSHIHTYTHSPIHTYTHTRIHTYYYQWLEEKDERAATNAQSLITSLLKNAGEDIGNKISITVQQISEKVEIDQFVRKMMISKQEVPDEDVSSSHIFSGRRFLGFPLPPALCIFSLSSLRP